jgi:hypothetical protein
MKSDEVVEDMDMMIMDLILTQLQQHMTLMDITKWR